MFAYDRRDGIKCSRQLRMFFKEAPQHPDILTLFDFGGVVKWTLECNWNLLFRITEVIHKVMGGHQQTFSQHSADL